MISRARSNKVTNALKANQKELEATIKLLIHFTDLAAKHDLRIKAYNETTLDYMRSLPTERLKGIREGFSAFHKVCQKVAQDKTSLKDSTAFVRSGLKYLNLTAPSEFFEMLEADDLVEIYDLSSIQIFRNLRFFEITNYSLGDLLTYSWHELYDRSSMISDKMAEGAAKVLTGSDPIMRLEVPLHLIKEIRTNPMQVCEVRFKYISPVYDLEGSKQGVIVSCQAKSLEQEISSKEIEFI